MQQRAKPVEAMQNILYRDNSSAGDKEITRSSLETSSKIRIGGRECLITEEGQSKLPTYNSPGTQ